MTDHMFYVNGSPGEVRAYQTGYLAGVREGVRLGREELAAEQLAAQAEQARRFPYDAEGKVQSLRAHRARTEGRHGRREAA